MRSKVESAQHPSQDLLGNMLIGFSNYLQQNLEGYKVDYKGLCTKRRRRFIIIAKEFPHQ